MLGVNSLMAAIRLSTAPSWGRGSQAPGAVGLLGSKIVANRLNINHF
jgi:hypothetical protein